jgi:hypothetical protein
MKVLHSIARQAARILLFPSGDLTIAAHASLIDT